MRILNKAGGIAGSLAFIPASLGLGLGALVAWGRARLVPRSSTISI
jgi:hypothetical protein